MKKAIAILCMTVFSLHAFAVDKKDSVDFYIGINPIAPFTGIPNQFTNLYLPLATNLETGLAVNFGLISNRHNAEVRLSAGKPNSLFSLWQMHSGYLYLIPQQNSNDLYLGGFLKYYHLKNTGTTTNYQSVISYAAVGYRIRKDVFYFDLRLNQNIYALSWSNLENSSLDSNFVFSTYRDISPVLPYFSFTITYELGRY